jgi:hypothetical protein
MELLFLILLTILVTHCVTYFYVNWSNKSRKKVRENSDFNRQILNAIYDVQTAELDAIRVDLPSLNAAGFLSRITEVHDRHIDRYRIYAKLDLDRNIVNPLTDGEYTFLTTAHSEMWAEVFD